MRVVVGLTLVCASRLGAQHVSEAVARARADSISICPAVSVRQESIPPGWGISTTPISLPADHGILGFSLSVDFPSARLRISPYAFLQLYSLLSEARLGTIKSITIIADDSIRIGLEPSAEFAGRPQLEQESVAARFPLIVLRRLQHATKMTLMFDRTPYPLSIGQVQAIRTVALTAEHPLSAQDDVTTGCVGPKPSELLAKWAAASQPTAPKVDSTLVTRGGRTYYEFQVEKPARAAPGNPSPTYPPTLRANHVEGEVTAQFTVLENGSADMDTFKVIRSTNDLFSASVRDVVQRMQFTPAEIGGKAVKQLVQLPFDFKINR
jgi:TonB family protein